MSISIIIPNTILHGIDIDECDSGTDDCSQFARCDNTDGSYECTCLDGYQGNGRSCLGGFIQFHNCAIM